MRIWMLLIFLLKDARDASAIRRGMDRTVFGSESGERNMCFTDSANHQSTGLDTWIPIPAKQLDPEEEELEAGPSWSG